MRTVTACMIKAAGANAEIPIDEDYMREQTPDFRGVDLRRLYLSEGLARKLNPTRYFLTEWYAWQNPDWENEHSTPYLHYLNVGRHQGRDPSPYVDIPRFRRAMGLDVPAHLAYDLLLSGRHAPWIGVYDGVADLRRMQQLFYDEIRVTAHRARSLAAPNRALIFLQAGRGAVTRNWLDISTPREWDLLVNYYDAFGFEPGQGDYVFFQKGTKFTAIHALWHRYRHVFEPYDHILFLDDDVETSIEDLNRLFATCRDQSLDLAQMTLTADSSSNWTELFDRPNKKGPRKISAVEIMMPVISQVALRQLAPTFGKSISGFGLDLTWGHIVRSAGGRIAVIDGISATHARPVDQNDGPYYSYLRSKGINAKAELWSLLEEYGAQKELLSG